MPEVSPKDFVETLANLNAVANQQTMQVLQVAALAMQLKGMNDLDPTQALLESKIAALFGGPRGVARAAKLFKPDQTPEI